MKLKTFILVFFCTLMMCSLVFGLPGINPVNVGFDHNKIDTLGYKIYWKSEGESFVEAKSRICGSLTELRCTVTDLAQQRYIVAVTAYNEHGESEFSNEVQLPFVQVPDAPVLYLKE